MFRPVTVNGIVVVVIDCTVRKLSVEYSILYWIISEPPSSAGGFHDNVTSESPLSAVTDSGSDGTVAGVSVAMLDDGP